MFHVSKPLSQAQQRYSNQKREALAIDFVLKRLKMIIVLWTGIKQESLDGQFRV